MRIQLPSFLAGERSLLTRKVTTVRASGKDWGKQRIYTEFWSRNFFWEH